MRLDSVVSALHSGNLAHRNAVLCDADVIAALGWVSSHDALGASLIRALLGDQQATTTAVIESARHAEKIRQRWRLPKGDNWWHRFATTAVELWQQPACKVCEGRKYQTIEGTPTLSDRACHSCNGTGLRKYPNLGGERLDKDPWRPRMNELINHIESRQQSAEQLLHKYLRG